MKERYKIVYQGGEGEIVEKKSRFIAEIRPVESEEEATAFIAEVKKKYWDARHHCSAFTIGENNEVARCSDDGEPAQTAGRPMLDVLLGRELHNVCAVVTRYFGGTLLGTGGLVRHTAVRSRKALKTVWFWKNAWLANGRSGQTTAGLERCSTFWQKQSCRFWTASTARAWI